MKIITGVCGSKKATARITIDAGSAVEYGGKWTPGIAHFLEHMIFQGTNKISHEELTKSMGMLGVDWNAATWHDKVSFYVITPAENIYEASSLLSDMLYDRTFQEADFIKEKDVILEEERGDRDDVEILVSEKFNAFLTKGPLSAPIIGTEKSIKSIELAEIQEFYKTYYKPKNMLVSITGPSSLEWKRFEEIFGKNTKKFSKTKKTPNKHTTTKRKNCYGNIQQARIYIAYKSCPIGHKYGLPLSFFDKIFGDDMDTRLFQTLRQKYGLCYGVGSYANPNSDIGWHVIWIRTAPENVKKSIKLIDEEVKKFLKDGPTDEEMKRAYNKFLSETYDYMETSYGYNSLITSMAYNDLLPIEQAVKAAKSIKASQIVDAARKVFTKENRQVFSYLPK